jgi:glutamate 5-kinase
VIARGIVNYDSGDLPPLLGKSTHALVEERGPAFDREVVHRDALIVKVGRTPR